MSRRPRPGFWWLFFFGRRRRGVPWLLIVLVVASVALALSYRLPQGVEVSYWLGLAFVAVIAILIVAALASVLLATLRRGRR